MASLAAKGSGLVSSKCHSSHKQIDDVKFFEFHWKFLISPNF